MAAAIADIVPPLPNSLAPLVEIEFGAKFDVGAAEAYPLAVDARKVRLSTPARAKTYIEGVIPHVQLGDVKCVDQREKIDRWDWFAVRPIDLMGDVLDVLI